MAGVPFESEIATFGFVKEQFPHGRTGEHVETGDRQMPGAHGAMLEGDAHTGIGGDAGNRFPEFEQARQEFFERFTDGIAAARIKS